MPNIHMSQNQSMSMQGGMGGMGGMGAHGGHGAHSAHAAHAPHAPHASHGGMHASAPQPPAMLQSFPSLHSSSFSGQPADFNLDFLDNMPSTDASNLTAQELLNSLDNAFLNDIL